MKKNLFFLPKLLITATVIFFISFKAYSDDIDTLLEQIKNLQTDIKTLILTDVASGTSNHAADISFNDGTIKFNEYLSIICPFGRPK